MTEIPHAKDLRASVEQTANEQTTAHRATLLAMLGRFIADREVALASGGMVTFRLSLVRDTGKLLAAWIHDRESIADELRAKGYNVHLNADTTHSISIQIVDRPQRQVIAE